MNLNNLVAGGVVVAVSGVALADHELQIDTDALSALADSAFSATYTGDLRIYNTLADPDIDATPDAKILDVLINGAAQGTGGATYDKFHFDMNIEFLLGEIVTGDVTIKVDQSGSEQTYTATLGASSGGAILDVGGGFFIIGGQTFEGLFSSPAGTFLGVDISPWGATQPLAGRFADIALNPRDMFGDGVIQDEDTDVDIFVIPLPGAAGLASLGIMGLVLRRRR